MGNQVFNTDVVVVGSGAGGMTAALVAKHAGLEVLIIEKTRYYGGSTARSGGGIWIPVNYLMREAGVDDSFEQARQYLQSTIGNRSPQVNQDAYLEYAPKMIEWLRDNSEVQCTYMKGYADYYPEEPGGKKEGRGLEPKLFNGRLLGEDLAFLRPPFVEAPGGLAFTAREYQQIGMIMRTWSAKTTALRAGFRHIGALLTGKKMLMLGQALAGRLRLSVKNREIPLWLNTPMSELIIEGSRVTGLIAQKDGVQIEIHASKGVILAAGGFEHNLAMREKYLPPPESSEWTVASEGNTGDAILAGIKAGGAVDLMDDAWWGPSSKPPGEPPFFHVGERGYPGLIIVNQLGERFTNESAPYIDVVHAMYANHSPTSPHIPSYFIFDQRYRDRYLFGLLLPRLPIPKKYLSNGYFKRSNTIEALESQLGLPPRKLADTITRFNSFAKSGVDLDFHRGESAYDHYYGDPTVKPNPNLAPLDKPPFYAVEALPGDLGTKGGLVIDEFARVLDENGRVIPGLYCTGNNAASVMGNSYPGPGGTIGPAMTFGYIASQHIAGNH